MRHPGLVDCTVTTLIFYIQSVLKAKALLEACLASLQPSWKPSWTHYHYSILIT